MSTWSHGYNTEVPYTFGYYRETDPVWLDFAALITGFWPPEPRPKRPLRYVDMGCGQGFGLCLTASLHPEMEFVGVDFNPTHIAHAQGLARRAGLGNVTFVEGDFVELGRAWPEALGRFDYVVFHGIWSWIAKPVREAAVSAVGRCLRPGGLVYNSYNAQPGWHAGSILRELLMSVSHAEADQMQLEALRRAIGVAKQLSEAGALVFRAYPGLGQRLQTIEKHDLRYVANEYINEAHAIFWGHEVVAEMAPAKLTLIASATLPENFLPALLPRAQAELIERFTHPALRHLLIDLSINQAFRRDLYQRGVVQATRFPQLERLFTMRVLGLRAEKREAKFSLSFGEVSGREEMYGPLFELLDAEPMTLQEIQARHPAKPNVFQLVQSIAVSAWDNRVAFAASQKDRQAAERTARAFNAAVMQAQREGRFYNWLAAPAACQGVSASTVEMLVLAAITLDGVPVAETERIVGAVVRDADRLELKFEKDGQPLVGEAREAEIQAQVREVLEKRLPVWAHLGII